MFLISIFLKREKREEQRGKKMKKRKEMERTISII